MRGRELTENLLSQNLAFFFLKRYRPIDPSIVARDSLLPAPQPGIGVMVRIGVCDVFIVLIIGANPSMIGVSSILR